MQLRHKIIQQGFILAHRTNEIAFVELAKDPQRYASAIERFNTAHRFEPKHILDHYSWDGLEEGVFVDVKGSYGSQLFGS